MDAALNLKEVARRLGVHYMTAYRYVRLGRLPAEWEGTGWRVTEDDLARFMAGPAEADPAETEDGPVDWPGRLTDRLLAGDEPGAWSVVEAALVAGISPQGCYLDLLGGALRRITEGAEPRLDTGLGHDGSRPSSVVSKQRNAPSDDIRSTEDSPTGHAATTPETAPWFDVADSYVATAIAARVVVRLGARFRRPGRTRGTVVLGAPLGEQHSLPITIVADLVRLAGFAVLELGANVPADAFVAAATRVERLVAVGIGVTRVDALTEAAQVVAAIRRVLPDAAVLVGGQAVRNPEMAALTGATGWAEDGAGLVVRLEELMRSRRSRPVGRAAPSAQVHLAP